MKATADLTSMSALAAALWLLAAGCAPAPDNAVVHDRFAASRRWAERLVAARAVNANWFADCVTDSVTGARRCFAGTFGTPVSASGEAAGPRRLPFQVYYVDGVGPYLLIGHLAGATPDPVVRVDGDAPVVVNARADSLSLKMRRDLVDRLKVAREVHARYFDAAGVPGDMVVDPGGFGQAWLRLQELRAGAVAPSDTI